MDSLEEETCMKEIENADDTAIEVAKHESVEWLPVQDNCYSNDESAELEDSSASTSVEMPYILNNMFEALGIEDFANEDSRIRFLNEQAQMFRHYSTQRHDGSNVMHSDNADTEQETGIFPVNSIHSEIIRNIIARSYSEQVAGQRLRTARHEIGFGNETSDDDDDENDNDLLSRLQLELMMRMVLLSEDGNIPLQDTRPVLECQVCFDSVHLTARSCCNKPVCDTCLQQYVETQLIDNGNLRIGCPNPDCDGRIYADEIRGVLRMKPELRDRYDRWIVDLNGDPKRKTCPRCCHITEIVPQIGRKMAKYGVLVECEECELKWCFTCQSPWHEGMSCKKFQAGDVLLKNWAREHVRGEYNAQRCPKCKVYIQRSDGCDHMTCSRCNTEFCYRCGSRRLPSLKLFGYPLEDHDLKRSIIGCNSDYKQGKPMQRAFTRGALFGVKVVSGAVAVPVVAGLAAGAVGLVAGVAVVALPVYGTYRLARRIRSRMRQSKL